MIFLKHNGLTLVEILLAWGMIAIFLSGAMWVQVEFLQKNRIQREKMIAQWQVEAMAERLMANKTDASQNRELNRWNEQNKVLFRNPKGELHCRGKICEIRLSWEHGQSVQLWV